MKEINLSKTKAWKRRWTSMGRFTGRSTGVRRMAQMDGTGCDFNGMQITLPRSQVSIVEAWTEKPSYNGGWNMVGIWAEAQVEIGGVIQIIRSGGLWGVESDTPAEYKEEIRQEEIRALKRILEEMGVENDERKQLVADS